MGEDFVPELIIDEGGDGRTATPRPALLGRFGDGEVHDANKRALQFARDHEGGAENGRLFGEWNRLVSDTLEPVCRDRQMQIVSFIGIAHRLGKMQEAVEAAFLIALNEARPRPERSALRQQPEMDDAARKVAALAKGADERVISGPPVFRAQHEFIPAANGKRITERHRCDRMAEPPQPRCQPLAMPGFVEEDQP